MVKKKIEQYQDRIARLFPQESTFTPIDAKDRSLARTVTFQVTDDCNLRCTYCYQINKSHHVMPFDIAKRFIDMLLEADEDSNEYINPTNSPAIIIEFIGGEPFLEIDLIDQITDYFIEQMIIKQHKWAARYMISICSNGVLYFNDKVQAYIKKHMHHLSFSISIDGNKELHDSCRVFPDGRGSYDIAIAGVKHFTEVLHGNMGSKMTLAPANIMHTYEATKSLIENGYTDINMNCVYEKGWEPCHATELYWQLKKLADYMLENNLIDTHYVGMFVADNFHPKADTDLQNWCFKAGTNILTPNGNIPIEDLLTGDLVITGSGAIQKVSNTLKRESNATAIIQATGMFKTSTTADHPYLAKKFKYRGWKGIRHFSDPGWVPVKDIKKGDKVALFCHNFGSINMDKYLAYIVGRYIGDGWHSTTGYKLCCSYDEAEELSKAIDRAGIHYSTDNYRTVKQFNIFKNNAVLLNILSQIGPNAHDKNIPSEAYQWDRDSVESLLNGLFDADGCHRNGYMKFNTVSSRLANDTLLLLRSLGYSPTCYLSKRAGKSVIEGREVTIRDRYEVYCKLDKRSPHCEYDAERNVVWTTVKKVETSCEPYEVYNLTVENEHTFVANGGIVHNCGGNGAMISVDYKGDIYPCIRYMESSLGEGIEPIIIGNVYDGIMATECQKDCVHCLRNIDRRTQSTDECFNCPIAEGCSWCTAYNYQEFGTADKRATYICEMHKARALANVYLWNSYFLKTGQNKLFHSYVPDEWALKIIPKEELDMLKSLERKSRYE